MESVRRGGPPPPLGDEEEEEEACRAKDRAGLEAATPLPLMDAAMALEARERTVRRAELMLRLRPEEAKAWHHQGETRDGHCQWGHNVE